MFSTTWKPLRYTWSPRYDRLLKIRVTDSVGDPKAFIDLSNSMPSQMVFRNGRAFFLHA